MKKYILFAMIGIFLLSFSLYSYNVESLECGECVCRVLEGGGDARLTGFELERNNCPNERPYPICGDENYAEDCRTRCVCWGGWDGRGGEEGGDVNIDENVTLLSVRNIGTVRIGVNGEEPCCVAEGSAPDEDEVCCENKPLDYRTAGSGRCGCPSGFGWDPLANNGVGGCQPRDFQRCGWNPNEEDPNQRQKCTALGYILSHPIECLFGGPESDEQFRGSLPYEQACCPLMEYDGEEYYSQQDVIVY